MYIEKLVALVTAENSGVVVKAVGIADDGEVRIVRTSRNANPYRLMQKHGLAEVWLNNVHHYLVDKALHEIVGSWAEEAEEVMNLFCEAGDYMCQLERFGVSTPRAKVLAEDYLATA